MRSIPRTRIACVSLRLRKFRLFEASRARARESTRLLSHLVSRRIATTCDVVRRRSVPLIERRRFFVEHRPQDHAGTAAVTSHNHSSWRSASSLVLKLRFSSIISRPRRSATSSSSLAGALIQSNGTPRPAMTWLMNYLGR
jgi:hypothetical protein